MTTEFKSKGKIKPLSCQPEPSANRCSAKVLPEDAFQEEGRGPEGRTEVQERMVSGIRSMWAGMRKKADAEGINSNKPRGSRR